jgi:hypothetical protein
MITEEVIQNAAKTINTGCMDKNICPTLFVPIVLDWEIGDPKKTNREGNGGTR